MSRYGYYYGVYDMTDDEACIGIYDSAKEIAEIFGKTEHQIWQCLGRQRKAEKAGNKEQPNWLTLGNKRYKIICFRPPTRTEVHRAGKAKYGAAWYCNNGRNSTEGFKIRNTNGEFETFAKTVEEAAEKLGLETED